MPRPHAPVVRPARLLAVFVVLALAACGDEATRVCRCPLIPPDGAASDGATGVLSLHPCTADLIDAGCTTAPRAVM